MTDPTTTVDAADRASECDRRYFERHPEQQSRARMLIPGEFSMFGTTEDGAEVFATMDESEIDLVRVVQIAPGVRTRLPLPRIVGCAS